MCPELLFNAAVSRWQHITLCSLFMGSGERRGEWEREREVFQHTLFWKDSPN